MIEAHFKKPKWKRTLNVASLKRGNTQLVPSAGKNVTSARRGEIWNLSQVSEKHATGAKRGESGSQCQARENMQPMTSAGERKRKKRDETV